MAAGQKTGGRKKGTPNKLTASMKDAFLNAYQDLQNEIDGKHGHLFQWAKDNPTDFYKICSKMIPQQVEADVKVAIGASELSDDELASIAARGSKRAAEAKEG